MKEENGQEEKLRCYKYKSRKYYGLQARETKHWIHSDKQLKHAKKKIKIKEACTKKMINLWYSALNFNGEKDKIRISKSNVYQG